MQSERSAERASMTATQAPAAYSLHLLGLRSLLLVQELLEALAAQLKEGGLEHVSRLGVQQRATAHSHLHRPEACHGTGDTGSRVLSPRMLACALKAPHSCSYALRTATIRLRCEVHAQPSPPLIHNNDSAPGDQGRPSASGHTPSNHPCRVLDSNTAHPYGHVEAG